MGQINLYVPGIRTFPGDEKNWDSKAVTYTHVYTGGRILAEKVEYFTTALLRPFGDRNRAEKLADALKAYTGWATCVIGHSNGCDVALDGLALAGWPQVEQLHLVCGACEASFERNGLNAALRARNVDHVFVYVADADQALRLAHTIPGKLLGYGTLGLHGAIDVAPDVKDRVIETHWPGWGHSTCWAGENFDGTMANFIA